MSFSVHSMAGVNSALQHMDALVSERLAVQTRVATGLKVGSAKDNGTIWAIAQGMRAANGAREASSRSIDMATGVVEVALAAATGISDLMVEMRSILVSATDKSLDEPTWRTLMHDYVILGNQINRLAENAEFNDINLLEAGASALSVLVGDDPSNTVTIAAENLVDGGGLVDAIISMGDGLKLPITAEGVENEQVLEALKAMGKLKGQGYHYGHPEPAEKVLERLQKQGRLFEDESSNVTAVDFGDKGCSPRESDARAS